MRQGMLAFVASFLFVASSIRSSTDDSEAVHNAVPVPSLPSVEGASQACPDSKAGTLVVKCIKAEGLDKKDWFSESDPYCSMLLSDSAEEEVRGWTGKTKAASKSDRMRGKTLQNTHEPDWKEAFGFHIACPILPKSYQVEVVVKHDGIIDKTLGRVILPLSDVMKSSGHEQAFELHDGSGTVTLQSHWCRLGDKSCTGDMTSDTFVDCGQSCHRQLRKVMHEEVAKIKSVLSSVRSAARMEAMADFMEDIHDSAGDAAEHRHGHDARATEDYHDQAEDTWDDIGDHFEDGVKRHWKVARRNAEMLPASLAYAAQAVCGNGISATAMSAASGVAFFKKYSSSAMSSAERQLKDVERAADSIYESMSQQLSEGKMVPQPDVPRHLTCRNYFGL